MYVYDTPLTRKVLDEWGRENGSLFAKKFIDQVTGRMMFNVSFQYDPFWEEKCKARDEDEALLLLDNAAYLHIQSSDSGWDYTLYDKTTMRELDGGQLDAPELSCTAAGFRICRDLEVAAKSIKSVPLSLVETLQDADFQQMQEKAGC